MKIVFLGTRGNIDAKTRRHRRHTITLIAHKRTRVMIDCGVDWLGKMPSINPRAIFTHCGSQIVKGDERTLGAQVRAFGKERDVEVAIAYDGMEIEV